MHQHSLPEPIIGGHNSAMSAGDGHRCGDAHHLHHPARGNVVEWPVLSRWPAGSTAIRRWRNPGL